MSDREVVSPWLAVLTTTKRTQYIRGTLEAIDAAGGAVFRGNRVVFVDGPMSQAPSVAAQGWAAINVSGGGPARGTRRALWRVLHLAAVARVPYLLFFEDDVRMSRHAVQAMAAIRVPAGLGFLTFCNQKAGLPATPSAPARIYERQAAAPNNAPGHWGNQALKIPDRSLALFRFPSTEPIDEYPFASDVWLGKQLRSYGIVLPSIVRHIGDETTIPCQAGMGIDGHRGGLNYAGDDFEALQFVATLGARGHVHLKVFNEPGGK